MGVKYQRRYPMATSSKTSNHGRTGGTALPSILDLSSDQLAQLIAKLGEPPFRARQLWRSLYKDAAQSFDEMTTLARSLRAKLAGSYSINPLDTVVSLDSKDGSTTKTLFRLPDGELIETVLMRYERDGHRRPRRTVCISTQAGCALGCTFCATGQQGFARQLSAGEIVAQTLHVVRAARAEDAAKRSDGKAGWPVPVSNVVFMGMGEPLANYDNTLEAISRLNDPQGVGIGARHMTVSTVGLAPQIVRLAGEPFQVNLAVSRHAPDDETRSETMPVNRRYPIATLLDACRKYVARTNRRVFFEYVLLEGQNDTPEHAHKLGKLLRGMLCHVNLIPVNPTSFGPYARPATRRTAAFRKALHTYGVPSTVRMEKGIDINAGCGQLRARELVEQG